MAESDPVPESLSNSQKEKYKQTILEGIKENPDMLADIIITVQEKDFKCHRLILALMSPYFKTMFTTGFLESDARRLTLPDLTAEAFTVLKNYMYSGTCSISQENAQEVLVGAAIFQLQDVQTDCEKMLEAEIDKNNCLEWFQFSRSYNCNILIKRCQTFILDGGCDLWNTDEFLKLDFEDIESVVRGDYLTITDEEQVCDAIIRWIENNQNEREHYVGRLLSHVRLFKVRPEYLVESLYCHPIFKKTECMKYFDEVRNYHLMPARKHEFSSKRFWLRNSDDFEQVIMAIAEPDLQKSGQESKDCKPIWVYSHMKNNWFTLNKVDLVENSQNQDEAPPQYRLITFDNLVFLSGGAVAQTKTLLKYDGVRDDWVSSSSDKDKMRKLRINHAMAAAGNSIYVIGGMNPKNSKIVSSIEEFNILHTKWEPCAHLKEGVSEMEAAALGLNVYIFGGKDKKGTYFPGVQVLNLREKEVYCNYTAFRDIAQPCQVVTVDGQISVFDKNGCVYDFKAKDMKFEKVKKLSDNILPIISVTQYRGKYMIISGQKNNHKVYSKLSELDLRSNPMHIREVQIEGREKPKYIHSCVNSIVRSEALYHTYYQ